MPGNGAAPAKPARDRYPSGRCRLFPLRHRQRRHKERRGMQEDCSAAVALSDEETYARQARENFRALLNDMCFFEELSILGVGRFQFSRRRRMVAEFRSVYMGVWRWTLPFREKRMLSLPPFARSICGVPVTDWLRTSCGRRKNTGICCVMLPQRIFAVWQNSWLIFRRAVTRSTGRLSRSSWLCIFGPYIA